MQELTGNTRGSRKISFASPKAERRCFASLAHLPDKKKDNEKFKEIADLIQEKIIEFSSKASNNVTSQISVSEEIEKLNNLFKSGAISEEEFTKAKDKLIS